MGLKVFGTEKKDEPQIQAHRVPDAAVSCAPTSPALARGYSFIGLKIFSANILQSLKERI
jgi:hypothetical protein